MRKNIQAEPTEDRIEKRKAASMFHDAWVPFAEKRMINMKNLNQKLCVLAALSCTLGLFALASLSIFDLAYPNLLFQIFSVAGLILIFLSLILFAAGWICSIRKELGAGNCLAALLLTLGGIVFIALHLLKML